MKISDIDYYSTYGNTYIHRLSAGRKLLAVFAVLILAISQNNLYLLSFVYFALLLIIAISGLKKKSIILSSFYPFIFLLIFFLSINNLTLKFVITVCLKVLAMSTAFSILIFTTSYIKIFNVLNKYMPSELAKIFFLTYRAFFILLQVLEKISISANLRGKPRLSRPLYSMKLIGNMIGLFIMKSIESNEKLYESLSLRGF